jgi:hypothetical protein
MEGKPQRLTAERLPPYLSYRAWQKLLGELRANNPPSRFDSSYFDGLKITKSHRSMVRGALLFLDLMTSDGRPTSKLHQLVKSEGEVRKAVLADVVRSAYAPLFTDKSMDVSRATRAQIKEYFDSQGASGDIGRKCLTFFCAVCKEANIALSPHLRKPVARDTKRQISGNGTVGQKSGRPVRTGGGSAWDKLLDKFPSFNPQWSDEVMIKWFDAFKYLKKTLETSPPRRRTSTSHR